MNKFSKKSLTNLSEAHPDLQRLFRVVVEYYDCSVVEGHRGQAEQDYAFKAGFSKLQWPDSAHNKLPSLAVDVWPYPRPEWNDITAWREFAFFVLGVAAAMNIKVKNGGLTWGWDYPHWELVQTSR